MSVEAYPEWCNPERLAKRVEELLQLNGMAPIDGKLLHIFAIAICEQLCVAAAALPGASR